MSAAKVLRLQEKILKRGWQLTQLYNDDQKAFVTRISGIVIDVGGEPRIWNLQKFVDETQATAALSVYDFWTVHYEKMIVEAEAYLKEAAAKIAAGEYIHDDRPKPASEDAGGTASDDQGTRNSGSGILDARGNPLS